MSLDDFNELQKKGLLLVVALAVTGGLAVFTSFSLTEAATFELMPLGFYLMGTMGDVAGTVLTSRGVVPASATGMGADIISAFAAVGGLTGDETLGALVGLLALGGVGVKRARKGP